MEPIQTSCKSDFTESEIQDGGEASSSKLQPEDNTTTTDSSSCSECSTRRNSGYGSDSFDDMELTLSSLFRTPSHTSTNHSSHINSPRTETTTTPLLDGFDLLFQRITNERFAELRDIQLSERPVTGGAARGNIESFMRRAVHGPTEEEQQIEDAANRPEHVASDQMFLRQQSVVQSSLQNDFRNILERTLLARMAPATTPAPRESEAPRGLVGGENFRSRLEALVFIMTIATVVFCCKKHRRTAATVVKVTPDTPNVVDAGHDNSEKKGGGKFSSPDGEFHMEFNDCHVHVSDKKDLVQS